MPGRSSSARRTSSRSAPRSSAIVAGGERGARGRPAPGRGRAASAASPGRAAASVGGVGEQVGERRRCRLGSGRPCSATSRAGDGAGAGDADLLAEHGADRELVAVDVAGHPQPRRRAGPAGRSPGRRRTRRRPPPGRSRRRAAGGPARRRRRCRAGRRARSVAGTKRSRPRSVRRRARAGRCRARAGRSRVRAYQPGRRRPRRPGPAWSARKASSARPGERRADGEPHASPRRWLAPRAAAAAQLGRAWRRRPRGRCR